MEEIPGMTPVRRAVLVLKELARHPGGLTLADLARQCEIPMTTVHRLVSVLREEGLVGEAESGRLRIGVESVVLARGFLDSVTVREVAKPEMVGLVAATDETCHLGVLASVDIVYLEKVDSPLPVRMVSRVGGTNPAITTAIGRAILAHSDDTTVRRVREGSAALFGLEVDEAVLESTLAEVRRQGFSTDLEENEPGICCVAAPIFDQTGRVVAGLSVSAPASRFDTSALGARGELVAKAAERVSSSLGWLP
jgi:DNA-binding IclR family transcriptional regulator